MFTLANGSQGIWLTIVYLYSFYRSLRKVERTSQFTKSTETESTERYGYAIAPAENQSKQHVSPMIESKEKKTEMSLDVEETNVAIAKPILA